MKRSLIASFAALGIIAAPAVAATPAKAPAKLSKQDQNAKLAGAKITKASAAKKKTR